MRCSMIEGNNNFNEQLNSMSNLSKDWGAIAKLQVGDLLYAGKSWSDKTDSLTPYPGFGVIYNTTAYLSSFIYTPIESTALQGPEVDSFKLLHDKVIQTVNTIATLDAGVHDSALKATDAFAAFKGLDSLEKNIAEAKDGLENFIKTHEGRTHNLTSNSEDGKVDDFLMDVKDMVGGQILDRIATIKEFISNDERVKPMLIAQKIYEEEFTNGAFQTLQLDEEMKNALDLSFFVDPSVEEQILAMGDMFMYGSPEENVRGIFQGIEAKTSLKKLEGSDLEMPEQFLKDFFRLTFLNVNNKEVIAARPDEGLSLEEKAVLLKEFISKCSEGLPEDENGLLFTQKIGRLMPQENMTDLFAKLSFTSLSDLETGMARPFTDHLPQKVDITIDENTVSIVLKKGIATLVEDGNDMKNDKYFVLKREITIPKNELLKDESTEDLALPGLKVKDSVSHELSSPVSFELLFNNL